MRTRNRIQAITFIKYTYFAREDILTLPEKYIFSEISVVLVQKDRSSTEPPAAPRGSSSFIRLPTISPPISSVTGGRL